MVVGSGMIANKFIKYSNIADVVLLASGVSNSFEQEASKFARELAMVEQHILENPDKLIVYFSTSAMYDPLSRYSPYTLHKLNVENYIKTHASRYLIFRVSQIIGKSNNNTLINFMIHHIKKQVAFEVWHGATRNLIDLDDVYRIIDYIIERKIFINKTINIANRANISVLELVECLERQLGIKGNYTLIDKGLPFDKIDISDIIPILNELSIDFDGNNYLVNAINQIIDANN